MPLASLVLVAVLAQAGSASYSPESHAATITKELKEVSLKLKEVEENGAATSPVGTLIGKYIGEDRRNQAALSNYLRKARGSDSVVALKMVRASGIWQGYLSSAVLALDGDEDSKQLRGVLEKWLAKLLGAGKVG